jgi:hypothetical protein
MGSAATYRKRNAKPFIVDIEARFLKKDAELKLTRGGRNLYVTCRALGDGQTGALCINGCPLDWQYICRQAEISHCTWRKYRHELLAAGLLWEQRDRVQIIKGGRRRVVLGRTTYFVRRQAETRETVKEPAFLLGANSSTIEELAPQITQRHLESSAQSVSGSPSSVSYLELEKSKSSSPTEKADDDAPSRFEKLQNAARATLLERGEDPEFVEVAIKFIDERSATLGKSPSSAAYYVVSFQTLKHNSEEMAMLWEVVNRRRELRSKWMPGFTGQLSAESEAQRQEFNRGVGYNAKAAQDANGDTR